MCRITYEYDGYLCYAIIEIKDEDENQQLTKCVSYECIWVITSLSSGECINSGLDYWNSGIVYWVVFKPGMCWPGL